MTDAGAPRQHDARGVRVRQRRERRVDGRARRVLRRPLAELVLRVAHVRVGGRDVPRQRGELVVIHHAHELQRRPQRTGQLRRHVGGAEATARTRRTRRGPVARSHLTPSHPPSPALTRPEAGHNG